MCSRQNQNSVVNGIGNAGSSDIFFLDVAEKNFPIWEFLENQVH